MASVVLASIHSLPVEILFAICKLLGLHHFPTNLDPQDEQSHRFFLQIRGVCRLFDDLISPFLFDHITLRVDPDGLRFKPPVWQLACGRARLCGWVKYLHIISSPASCFAPERVKKLDSDERALLKQELERYFTPAVAAMKGLISFKWTLTQDLPAPQHFQAAITRALVDLPSLTDLNLGFLRELTPSAVLDSRWTVPCRPNLTMISASIRHLTKLHFRLHPHLYPEVWVELLSLNVQLTDIAVDSFSETLLEYLGSYNGLQSFSMKYARPVSLIPQSVARGLFDALGNHKDTLSVLLLPHFDGLPLPWWTLQANAAALVTFTHLRHLSLSVIIRDLSQAESGVTRELELLSKIKSLEHYSINECEFASMGRQETVSNVLACLDLTDFAHTPSRISVHKSFFTRYFRLETFRDKDGVEKKRYSFCNSLWELPSTENLC